MAHVVSSICRISYWGRTSTGSLLSVENSETQETIRLLVTCKQTLKDFDFGDLKHIRFDFQQAKIKFSADEFCAGNPKLIFIPHDRLDRDLDIVALRWAPSFILHEDLKFLETRKFIPKGDEVFVAHFPEGDAQKISGGKIEDIKPVGKTKELSYAANTAKGSIGAPVVDKRGKVVGIHQRDVVKIIKEEQKKEAKIQIDPTDRIAKEGKKEPDKKDAKEKEEKREEKGGEGSAIEFIQNELGAMYKSMVKTYKWHAPSARWEYKENFPSPRNENFLCKK